MILVNVFFQELNQDYDFQIEEQASTNLVIQEMVQTIAQKEQLTVQKGEELYLLCQKRSGTILHPASTIAENGVRSGDTLLLV